MPLFGRLAVYRAEDIVVVAIRLMRGGQGRPQRLRTFRIANRVCELESGSPLTGGPVA